MAAHGDLISAVQANDLEGAARAIDEGADVNAVADPEDGNTVLMLAAMAGRIELVKLLLQKGAKLERRRQDGATALIAAAMYEQRRVAKFLIKQGADARAENNHGFGARTRWRDGVPELPEKDDFEPQRELTPAEFARERFT